MISFDSETFVVCVFAFPIALKPRGAPDHLKIGVADVMGACFRRKGDEFEIAWRLRTHSDDLPPGESRDAKDWDGIKAKPGVTAEQAMEMSRKVVESLKDKMTNESKGLLCGEGFFFVANDYGDKALKAFQEFAKGVSGLFVVSATEGEPEYEQMLERMKEGKTDLVSTTTTDTGTDTEPEEVVAQPTEEQIAAAAAKNGEAS